MLEDNINENKNIKKKAFFLIAIACLSMFLTSFSSAASPQIIAHGVTNDTVTSANGIYGMLINVSLDNMVLNSIKKWSPSGAIAVNLRETKGGQNISTCIFTGDECIFSPTPMLVKGRQYYIIANQSGAIDVAYRNSASAFPLPSGTNGTFMNGTATFNGGDIDRAFHFQSFNISLANTVLNFPLNSSSTSSSNLNFSATINPDNTMNFANATFYIWYLNGTLFNQTINLTNIQNTSNLTINGFTLGTYIWNVYGCEKNVTASTCSFAVSNYTFNIGSTVNTNVFNLGTYETSAETFTTNITVISSTTLSSANLYYNLTAYSGTISGTGPNYILKRTLDIPFAGNNSWFWSLNYANGIQQNLSLNYQNTSAINLSLCGISPQNIPYINFTFQDESNSNSINATVDASTWTYYLGSGSINKTLIYSNAAALGSYAFCFTPNNVTLTTVPNFKYSNSGYPQRTYAPISLTLTNSVTNTILYLLSSANGIYSSFQTMQQSTPISGVNIVIQRLINNILTTIGQGTTDSSGLITFWVNPNFVHTITASKTGYTTQIVSITPTQSLYTILMTNTNGSASYVSEVPGIRWTFGPAVGPLSLGLHTFNVSVLSELANLENCKFELTNVSNYSQIYSSSTGITNSSYCYLSIPYTIGTGQKIFGRLSVDTSSTNGFVYVDTDAKWVALDINRSTIGTIPSIFSDLTTLTDFGTDSNQAEFSRYILFFFLATLCIGLFFFFTQIEITNPGISILIMWFIVLVGSFGGFFTVNSGSSQINAAMYQYGFLVIYSLIAGGYVINNFRRSAEYG